MEHKHRTGWTLFFVKSAVGEGEKNEKSICLWRLRVPKAFNFHLAVHASQFILEFIRSSNDVALAAFLAFGGKLYLCKLTHP